MATARLMQAGRTLLVASAGDPASMNIARALLARADQWEPTQSPHLFLGRYNTGVLLWLQEQSLLTLVGG